MRDALSAIPTSKEINYYNHLVNHEYRKSEKVLSLAGMAQLRIKPINQAGQPGKYDLMYNLSGDNLLWKDTLVGFAHLGDGLFDV